MVKPKLLSVKPTWCTRNILVWGVKMGVTMGSTEWVGDNSTTGAAGVANTLYIV